MANAFAEAFPAEGFSPPNCRGTALLVFPGIPRPTVAARDMSGRKRRNCSRASRRTRRRLAISATNGGWSPCWCAAGTSQGRPQRSAIWWPGWPTRACSACAACWSAPSPTRPTPPCWASVCRRRWCRRRMSMWRSSPTCPPRSAMPRDRWRMSSGRSMPSFRPVPHIDPRRVASYAAASGLRVDFLTPNRGPETEEPRKLPALGTDAQPLRFLDFLIRDPEPAVLLHGAGVLVSVPAPQRYALHKLIVARRRREGDPKREKDRLQAQALLDALIRRRPHELRARLGRGIRPRQDLAAIVGRGAGTAASGDPRSRAADRRSTTRGHSRSRSAFRARKDCVTTMKRRRCFSLPRRGPDAGGFRRYSAASSTGDALEACFGPGPFDRAGCLAAFRQHRSLIEQVAREKYLQGAGCASTTA